jgi:hypothetical protein
MLMKHTSASQTGLSAKELAAALTPQQWLDLESFAIKRLHRAASNPARQRALAQFTERSLINTAIEKFLLGDCGHPGGRYLSPPQRVSTATFMNAVRGVINSLISDGCRTAEYELDWVAIGNDGEPDHCEPSDPRDAAEALSVRDLERQLFAELAAHASKDPDQQAAVNELRDDCVTGHRRGSGGSNTETKRQVRRRARAVWEHLAMD